MNNVWATKKGFTIIELLVSIVVIAILVTVMIISYNGVQQRSRDSRRASDVTQIKIAIEKYHAEKSQYPAVCAGGDNVDCSVSSLASALLPYLAVIPHDPKNTADSSTDYRYIRAPYASSDAYGILVTNEAKATCKTGQNIQTAWWSSTIPTC